MPSSESSLIKNLVSERLKVVDGLVKAQKIDEAIKEITEIRRLDARNPYALAYEERILSLKKTIVVQPPRSTSTPPQPATESKKDVPPPAKEITRQAQSFVATTTVVPPAVQKFSIVPETQVSQVKDSSNQLPENFIRRSKGKASILLVDDDSLLVQALSEFLEDNRYSTTTYTKADDALEYLKVNTPDLIICDVNLETSSFGGFTLHERMRKLDHLRDVPFIFLSGLNDSAIVLAGKEVGADDYLTKPVEPEALLSVVKGKLKRYRQIKKNP